MALSLTHAHIYIHTHIHKLGAIFGLLADFYDGSLSYTRTHIHSHSHTQTRCYFWATRWLLWWSTCGVDEMRRSPWIFWCVWERKTERESVCVFGCVCVWVCLCVHVWGRQNETFSMNFRDCVCVRERERECLCVFECVYVCMWGVNEMRRSRGIFWFEGERERECVCVCLWVCVCVHVKMRRSQWISFVCTCERESVCACLCASVCARVG